MPDPTRDAVDGLIDDLVAAAFDAGRSADDDVSPAVHCATVKSALLAALSGRADQAQPGAVERYIPDRHADSMMRQVEGGSWVRYTDHLNAIAAARAEGATAERARLAGMASEEDRGMVDALDSICRSGRVTHLEWLEAYTTLLARLAAARGEALEEDRLVEFQKLVSAHVSATRVGPRPPGRAHEGGGCVSDAVPCPICKGIGLRERHGKCFRCDRCDGEGSLWPCDRCGTLRSKPEGGTTFTVCDSCWDNSPRDGTGVGRG